MMQNLRPKIVETIGRLNVTRTVCAAILVILIISTLPLISLIPDPNVVQFMPCEGTNWTWIFMLLFYLWAYALVFLGLFGVTDLGD